MSGTSQAGYDYDFDSVTGWKEIRDSWSYLSATSVTVPSNATTKYSKGMRVRLKQGGAYKYYNLTSVASSTVLNLNGFDLNSVANAGITDIAVSLFERPLDFPEWFAWTPSSYTGFSSNPTGGYFYIKIIGEEAELQFWTGSGAGNSNLTTFSMALPLQAKAITNVDWIHHGIGFDNTSTFQPTVISDIVQNGTSVVFATNGSLTAGWTNAGTKRVLFSGVKYQYAG